MLQWILPIYCVILIYSGQFFKFLCSILSFCIDPCPMAPIFASCCAATGKRSGFALRLMNAGMEEWHCCSGYVCKGMMEPPLERWSSVTVLWLTHFGIIARVKQSHGDPVPQSGGWGLKNTHCGSFFSSSFDNSRKNKGKHLLGFLLRDSTIAIITPMRQARTCGRVRVPGPTPSAPKQRKSNDVKNKKKLRDCHRRSPRKKKLQGLSSIKARVWVYWRAQCNARWPRGGREFQHLARIEPESPDSLQFRVTLTTKPWIRFNL